MRINLLLISISTVHGWKHWFCLRQFTMSITIHAKPTFIITCSAWSLILAELGSIGLGVNGALAGLAGRLSEVAVKLAGVVAHLSWVADVEDCGNLAWHTWKHVLISQWENESDTSELEQSSSLQTQDLKLRGHLSQNCDLGRTLHI